MSAPQPLAVDPVRNEREIARFWSSVVRGPGADDCWVWVGAIGDDGYGRFWIKRDGRQRAVRPHRYALVLANGGAPLPLDWVSLHLCDVPLCVRAGAHVVAGTPRENSRDMAEKGRVRGRWNRWLPGTGRDRAERSRAVRAAVRDGWDGQRFRDALHGAGDHPALF
ncbi:HNH endonuclease [Hoyosella subflava]|nr:HNH endonuclease [Hoyosella subflava]